MYSILLVDDHAIIRSGLKLLIESDYKSAEIDEAIDGDSAYAAVKAKNYDLIVLDINMPGTDTINLIENIKLLRPSILILLFSMNPELVFAKRYLKLGVNGFLNKEADNTQIIEAIRCVLLKKRYLSQELQQFLSDEAISGVQETPFSKLSDREFEVALLIIKGKGISEIANFLHLSTSTIGTYKGKIFEKCSVSSVVELHELAKVYNVSGMV
jgi:DNA-binding NarL/FixJ family response regulator